MATGKDITRRQFMKYTAEAAAVICLEKEYNLLDKAANYLCSTSFGASLEDRFFNKEKNTRISFDKLFDKYDESGRDEIVGNISMRALKEKNEKRAVCSDSYEKNFAFGDDYATAKRVAMKNGLTLYHFGDDDITKKLYGMESDFIDII